MSPRFHFFADDLFTHADSIQIKLHKFRGKLAVEFQIAGEIWPDIDLNDDDDTASGDLCTAEDSRDPDPAVLAKSLLAAFLCSQKGGGR